MSQPAPTTPLEFTGRSSFLQGLAIQRRVLHALMMREIITRFGRENLGVLWLFAEPMLFTVGVTTLWTAAKLNHGSRLPIVAFAVTGYSSVLMWRNAASQCSVAVEANKSLLYHRSVQVIDLLLTRIALEVAGASASFLILATLFGFLGWMPPPVDLLQVLFGWLMLAWVGGSLALLIGAGSAVTPLVHRLWHPTAYLLFPLSGAAFMVDWLPRRFRDLVLLLPMVHGVEMLREGWFGNLVHTHYSVGYLTACCLVLTLAGLCVLRIAAARL